MCSGPSGGSSGGSGSNITSSDVKSMESKYGSGASSNEYVMAAGIDKATGGKYGAENVSELREVSADATNKSELSQNIKEEVSDLRSQGYSKEGSYTYSESSQGNFGSTVTETTMGTVMSKNGDVAVVYGSYEKEKKR